MTNKNFKKLKLSDKPGVYFFLGSPKRSGGGLKGREILYIGKATSLRGRVKSYFKKDLIETRGPLLVDMVFKARKIDWQETDSVLEALVLEANLIKKYQPKYNTKEKSDKSFNYVYITAEKLPKVIVVRGKKLGSGYNTFEKSGFPVLCLRGRIFQKYYIRCLFGPYPNGSQLKEAMKIIRKIFPFLDDKSKNYIEFYRQINLAPDLNDKKLYLQNIKNIKLFFSGKKRQIFRNLKKEMNAYSKMREFEKAGEIKRQLFTLQHINDVALIKENEFPPLLFNSPHPNPLLIKERGNSFRIEAYDIAHMGGKNMVGVMIVLEDGEAVKNKYRKFKIKNQNNANDTGALAEVLERRLAHKEWTHPDLIVVDGGIAQINAAKRILAKIVLNIPVVSALKDEWHKPKNILGDKNFVAKYEREILLANSEAHRFAIAYHKKMRNKNFLG